MKDEETRERNWHWEPVGTGNMGMGDEWRKRDRSDEELEEAETGTRWSMRVD